MHCNRAFDQHLNGKNRIKVGVRVFFWPLLHADIHADTHTQTQKKKTKKLSVLQIENVYANIFFSTEGTRVRDIPITPS